MTAARRPGRGSLWAEFCSAGPLRANDVRRGGECGSRVSRTCFGSYTIFERVGSVPSSQLARGKSGIAVLFPGDMAPSLPSVVVLLLCVTLVPCVFGMFYLFVSFFTSFCTLSEAHFMGLTCENQLFDVS